MNSLFEKPKIKNNFTDMNKIESFLSKNLSKQSNILSIQSIEDNEDYERIFVMKTSNNLSSKEISDLLSEINRELYYFCKSNGLLDLFNQSLVLLKH